MSMEYHFTVPGRLPGYNELHGAGWRKSHRIKTEAMGRVMWAAKAARIPPITGRCTVEISCREPNARRDVDNVTSGAGKIILDAMQQAGILAGDGRKYVGQVAYMPVTVDRYNPRVEVTIREAEG